MELESRQVYDDLQSYEARFGKDSYPEPPSQEECRTKVCAWVGCCILAREFCVYVRALVRVCEQPADRPTECACGHVRDLQNFTVFTMVTSIGEVSY
jgi:hypothetical protein